MCNACGIYFKNHGRHRPLELIESAGSGAFGRGDDAGPAPPALPLIKAEVRRLVASNSTPSFLLNRCAPVENLKDCYLVMARLPIRVRG